MNNRNERYKNLLHVVDVLRKHGSLSQAQLSDLCGLQASTISYLVNDLRKYNLIRDIGKVQSRSNHAGKPGFAISLNNEAAIFLGAYLEDSYIDFSLYGLDGRLLECERIEFEDMTMEDAMDDGVGRMITRYPQIKKIGIAVKGLIHSDGRLESGDRHLPSGKVEHWNISDFTGKVKRRYPEHDLIIENDANCAAVCFKFEDSEDVSNSITYVLNNRPFGIGIGLIINGHLYKGFSGVAGEFYDNDIDSFCRDDIRSTISFLLNHMMMSTLLLNPEKIIISGSSFSTLDTETISEINEKLSCIPTKVELKIEENFSAPARGAALMVADTFIQELIGGMERRW